MLQEKELAFSERNFEIPIIKGLNSDTNYTLYDCHLFQ